MQLQQISKRDRSRICFNRDFCIFCERKISVNGFENKFKLFRCEQRRRSPAEKDRVDIPQPPLEVPLRRAGADPVSLFTTRTPRLVHRSRRTNRPAVRRRGQFSRRVLHRRHGDQLLLGPAVRTAPPRRCRRSAACSEHALGTSKSGEACPVLARCVSKGAPRVGVSLATCDSTNGPARDAARSFRSGSGVSRNGPERRGVPLVPGDLPR